MRAERGKTNASVAADTLRLTSGRAEMPAAEGICALLLVSGGSCTLTYGENVTALNPGCAVLLDITHGGLLQQVGRTVPELAFCAFSAAALSELRGASQRDFSKLLSADAPTVLHGSAQWNSRIRTLLELMRSAQSEPDFPGMAYLVLVLHYAEQQYAAESRAATRPHNETIDQVCSYLAANYAQKLSLAEVATQFYLSPYYLSRLFRRVTGQSIVDYINSRRIEAAQRLLESTDLSISDVAEQTGFSTAAHFRRVFRELMGMSPLQYRKGHRAE